MAMTNTVRELKKNMEDMLNVCKRKIGEEMFDADCIDVEAFELMQGMFKMCDLSMKLMEEQAETIDEINNKLDKLLERS